MTDMRGGADQAAQSDRSDADESAGYDYDRAFRQLCHLAALNRTEKIDGAIDSLILTTLVVDPNTSYRSAKHLDDAVFVLFGSRLATDQIDASLERLLGAGRLAYDTEGGLRPSLAERATFEERIAQARQLENQVRSEWIRQVHEALPEVGLDNELWGAVQRYLALAFRRHGAETALLLDPNSNIPAPSGTLTGYLEQAIVEAGLAGHRAIAEEAIDIFLSQATPDRTKYLAQLLDGTFTFFALTLDEATSEYLKGSLSPLTVFLDTNYIFGLLDLHENFFSRASKELVRFVQENSLPFRMYYHEYTHDEIVRTLSAQAENLRTRRWTRALSQAAVEIDTLSGLERLYHQTNAQQTVDVEVFLSRFEDVKLLLQPLGIEIYRESGRDPFTTEEKGLVVAEFAAFLDEHGRERSYNAIDHDAALWLAVQRARSRGRPVLDSGAIILTNDYWLHRFDREHRSARLRTSPGGVVLPTQLLQLLRPMVPATDDFDRRFVETFALPEFRTAQSGYGRTSSKVLGYLATYKDLPKETAVAVLKSHALSTKVRDLDEDDPRFKDAVESELVDANRSLREEMKRLQIEITSASSHAGHPEQRVAPQSSMEADSVLLRGEVEQLRRANRVALGVVAALVFAMLLAVVWFGPHVINWSSLLGHPESVGLRLAASVVALGFAWMIFPRDRRVPLTVCVIGGLLVIAQLVGF